MTDEKKQIKRFPLRLEEEFSTEIDNCVFYTKYSSKHQYIIDAIKEKIERDKLNYNIGSNNIGGGR